MSVTEVRRDLWEVATDAPAILALRESVHEAQMRVLNHPIYGELTSREDLVAFMELHVFAVWDFMCLLKSLQRRFTCVDVPWLPASSTLACRLINEIVLVEESDAVGIDYASHFALYLSAMEDLGANTAPIRRFIELLAEGVEVPSALESADVPAAAAVFVRNTWDIVESGNSHEIAAAFALTREDLIPEMFGRVISADGIGRERMKRFVDYLERHIQVDAEEHTPMAFELLVELCGEDARKWEECAAVARRCFGSRYELWSGVLEEVVARRSFTAPSFDVLAVLELPDLLEAGHLEASLVIDGGRLLLRARRPECTGQEPCRLELPLPAGVPAESVSAVTHDATLEIRVARPDGHRHEAVTRVPIRRA